MSKTIYHNHHIVPKHTGGTDDPENIVRLTTAEHAEAHRLLYEQYGRWQDKVAWRSLAGHIGKEEIIHEVLVYSKLGKKRPPRSKEWCKKISEAKKSGKKSGKKGYKWTEEQKRKMREKLKGRVFSEEHRAKLSIAKMGNTNGLGWKHSAESKKKMSEAKMGVKRGPYKKKSP